MDSKNLELQEFLAEWNNDEDKVLVHTSGSTGKPKPMMVEKSRMLASARLTCDFLGLKPGDSALLCMPLQYIAGKMVVVRALERGLKLIAMPPTSHPLRDVVEIPTFAAMVPMQVYNTLLVDDEAQKLRQIKHLIIGGGAIDDALEQKLTDFPNAVWSTYGMTETLSHVAMRRINGEDASLFYQPMGGVQISISERGTLCVNAPLVHEGLLETNDIAIVREDGCFQIVGRIDNVVCSGGVKIQIESVENQLDRLYFGNYYSKPMEGERIQLTCVKDEQFGEALTAIIEGGKEQQVKWEKCFSQLRKHWQPKKIFLVDRLHQTATGKPDRAWAKAFCERKE